MPSDWERVAHDPALLAAVRRHYRGSGDALDRLWWAEHPGEATPTGIPDPADAVERARRGLFQRGSGSVSAEEVERAAEAIAADREAARSALADADRDVLHEAATSRSAASRRRGVDAFLAGAVLTALLVGVAAGLTLGRFSGRPAPTGLTVFARTQRTDDRPPKGADVPSEIARSSTRFLGASGTSGTAMYAARATDGRVCLIAVVLADEVITSCVSDAAFAESGLSLMFSAAVDATDDSGIASPQELRPTWSPDGRLRF